MPPRKKQKPTQRPPRQLVDESKPRALATSTDVGSVDQLLEAIRWPMETRFRVFKANPSLQNWARLQSALLAFQVVQSASTGVYRAQLVALWSSCGRDVDRFAAQL